MTHLVSASPMLDAGRKGIFHRKHTFCFGRQLFTKTVEKINYTLDLRVGCSEQPMHQNIHTLPKRLNSEQNFIQGTESEDTDMVKNTQVRESKLGNHREVTVLGLRNTRKQGKTEQAGLLACRGMIGNHLNQ